MYLDRYFTDKEAFAADLNAFIEKVKVESFGAIDIEPFTPENMNKLAFMCATGSGKTLIMHINILQFRYHLRKAKLTNPRLDINKIIVLAPNQGMSNQHLEELKLSNISRNLFKDIFGTTADVIVIDMNKLKEEGKVKPFQLTASSRTTSCLWTKHTAASREMCGMTTVRAFRQRVALPLNIPQH